MKTYCSEQELQSPDFRTFGPNFHALATARDRDFFEFFFDFHG